MAGLLTLPAGNGPAGRLVVTRLLVSMFELLTAGEVEEELERAERCVEGLTATDTASEATVRQWLTRACRDRVQDHNWDFEEGEWGSVGDDHDVWTLLVLGPFARRLRLWTNAVKLSAPALGAAMGVGAHQIRHWASGRTLPSADHRTALAEAMGVHPAWLAAARDHSGDSDLYLYPRCPCHTGAGFTRDVVETAQAELSVRWCRGCGQPSVSAGTGGLLPLPVAELTRPPSAGSDEPFAFHAVHTKSGRDLSAPWPHGLWCPGADARQRGPVRIPDLLTRPPVTRPLPAPPPPPRQPVVRRRTRRHDGQVPAAAVTRSGPAKIQAFLRWIGDGRHLTVTGQLRLADARMLVDALPTGDAWDPVEYGYQCRTRSSAELPHLQRIVSWTRLAGLLVIDGDLLAPAPGVDPRRFEDLPALVRTLAEALPAVAVHHLTTQAQLLSPIAEDEGVHLALAVVRHVLLRAVEPVAETVVGDVLWRELTCDGEDPFEEDEPGEAERTVRRDLGRLLVVCQDLALVDRTAELLALTETGRVLRWAGELDPDSWYLAGGEEPEEDKEVGPPNYANLFPLRHTRSNAWQFTPRTAFVLDALLMEMGAEAAAAADVLKDTVLAEEDRTRGGGLFGDLPRATWAQGYCWRRDVAHRIYDLARDIAAGTVPQPRCVAERVALDVALNRARAYAYGLAGVTPAYDQLPEHRDDDWDRVDRALRAADHPVTEGLPRLWRVGPDHWFIPFDKSPPRAR
ncbi:hypothetical protein ACIQVO_38350 [Streptomyces sp. NPDC101062]|uniref:hypothetical protein n=1 Tax=unclassified Streptomyces TaxID=2593676 RepID=UPI0038210CF5